jgi:hypothetical protein
MRRHRRQRRRHTINQYICMFSTTYIQRAHRSRGSFALHSSYRVRFAHAPLSLEASHPHTAPLPPQRSTRHHVSTKPITPSMTQIPPPLLNPPHQRLPPLLRPNPTQKPMSPLPHQMARVVRISRTASDLHATQARMRRDFAGEIECFRGTGEHRGSRRWER